MSTNELEKLTIIKFISEIVNILRKHSLYNDE